MKSLISQCEIRARVSSILKKLYWISAQKNSSPKLEMHIYFLKKQGRLDSMLICVCLISQKTIQYVPCLKIVDSLALCAKMINAVNNIHYFEINQLLDSAIKIFNSVGFNAAQC